MSLEDDILIEKFIKNTLSPEQNELFLNRLKSDKEFKEKYRLEKQLYESLDENDWSFAENSSDEVKKWVDNFSSEESRSIKKTIDEVANQYKNKSKVRRLWYFSGVVAAILILFNVLNFGKKKNFSNEGLFSEYINLEELPTFISRGEDEGDLIDGEKFFKNKEYKKSLKVYVEFLKLKPKESGTIYLYKAIAHIELAQYKKAEETLNTLIKSDFIDSEKGYWYKALLYVKMNELEKSKSLLKLIIEKSYYKNKEAKKLLEELN
ncbi:conserved protein of unknown function [Tenacibaculum sp. 190524A02b]|uniref:Tetratricopeptide repeat protein n=1 Tax=Tenacibaculum vairaonense TaxID=3137860 RepID=A0ABP1FCC5_9FLAO